MTDRARWNLGNGYADYFLSDIFGSEILEPPEVTIDCLPREPK